MASDVRWRVRKSCICFLSYVFFPNKVPVHMFPFAHMAALLPASVDRTIMVDVLLHVKWCILQL